MSLASMAPQRDPIAEVLPVYSAPALPAAPVPTPSETNARPGDRSQWERIVSGAGHRTPHQATAPAGAEQGATASYIARELLEEDRS